MARSTQKRRTSAATSLAAAMPDYSHARLKTSPPSVSDGLGRRQTRKRRLIRENILASAAKLFAERGVQRVSIDDVASCLGYTRSNVYYYFKNRGDLLWSIFGFISSHFMGAAERIAKEVDDPSARFTALVRMHVRFSVDHKDWATVFYRDVTALPRQRQKEVHDIIIRYHTIFRQAVLDGAQNRQMRGVQPDIAVNAITGACNWLVNWYTPRYADRVDEIIDTFVTLFSSGLLHPGTPAGKSVAPGPAHSAP
jgi:AcrR family transcriptional regulator